MVTANDNFNGIQEYAEDQGLKLDWIDQQGEWGVKASADGQKGMTLSDVQVGSYGRPGAHVRQHDRQAARRGGASQRLPHRRLPGPHQVGHLVGERRDALRGGAPTAVEFGYRRAVGDDPSPTGRRRARPVPVGDVPHRGRVRSRRRAGPLGSGHVSGLLRASNVPHHADHGRVAPPRRLPQARPGERRRADAASPT